MGTFSTQGITAVGRMLLATVQAGAEFTATRLVMGSGTMQAGITVDNITAVIAPVKELAIIKKERTNDAKVIFGGVYSNQDIQTAFYFREFALYAKAKLSDGTFTDEVLYAYGNSGDTADLMPAYSTNTNIEKQLDLIVYVGNNTAVNLTVDSTAYVSQASLANTLADYATKDDLESAVYITDTITAKKYAWGMDNGAVYLQEV